jgi:hypothetical protein
VLCFLSFCEGPYHKPLVCYAIKLLLVLLQGFIFVFSGGLHHKPLVCYIVKLLLVLLYGFIFAFSGGYTIKTKKKKTKNKRVDKH